MTHYSRFWECNVCGERCESVDRPRRPEHAVCEPCAQKAARRALAGRNALGEAMNRDGSTEHNGPTYSKQPRVSVSNDELVTVRDAMRGLNQMVARLESREVDQFVLMHRGRMVAVLSRLPEGDPRRP